MNSLKKHIFAGSRQVQDEFVSTWDTTVEDTTPDDQIALPLLDPNVTDAFYFARVFYKGKYIKTIQDQTDRFITFPDGPGTKQINIIGKFQGFNFNGQVGFGDSRKIKSIEKFGHNFKLLNGERTFKDCVYLTHVAGDLDTEHFTTFEKYFSGCVNLKYADVSQYKTGNSDNFKEFAFNCLNAEKWEVSNFDMSIAKIVYRMFMANQSCNSLPIYEWNVGNVKDAAQFARGMPIPSDFDPSNWDISKFEDMTNFITGTNAMPTSVYSNCLTNWNQLQLQSEVQANFGSSKYNRLAASDRSDIINLNNWTIDDGGEV